jgi:hypothetical protein
MNQKRRSVRQETTPQTQTVARLVLEVGEQFGGQIGEQIGEQRQTNAITINKELMWKLVMKITRTNARNSKPHQLDMVRCVEIFSNDADKFVDSQHSIRLYCLKILRERTPAQCLQIFC